MHIYKDCRLSSTTLDSHGEKFERNDLDQFARMERIPLWTEHRSDMPTLGFITNLRVEEIDKDYFLIGDIHAYKPLDVSNGFNLSVGATRISHMVENSVLTIFIPYPWYQNEALLEKLSSEEKVSIGQYVKKELDPNAFALIVSTIALLVGPEWNRQYGVRVRPVLLEALRIIRTRLLDMGIQADLHQTLKLKTGSKVLLKLIPGTKPNNTSYSIDCIDQAISEATELCMRRGDSIQEITMIFDQKIGSYKFYLTTSIDGREEFEL